MTQDKGGVGKGELDTNFARVVLTLVLVISKISKQRFWGLNMQHLK